MGDLDRLDQRVGSIGGVGLDRRPNGFAAEGDYLIDVAFPAAMLAVEIDGFAYHRDATAFQHDRTRRNTLIAKGWTVLNFTWSDLVERPDYVISSIEAALEAAAA